MALLDKHDVAKYDDLKSKVIDVWGGQLKIRVMNMKEQQEYSDFLATNPDDKTFSFFLLKKCCVNEDGSSLFADCDDDILNNKSVQSINVVIQEILALSNQGKDDVDKLAKNS